MDEIWLLLLSVVFIYIFYQFFFILPRKKKGSNKKELMEIKYLENKYHLDMDKISYPQLLQICAIVSSIDISIIVGVIALIPNLWLKLLVGFILIFVLIIGSYHLVYLFYKKKGMIRDGKH